jgi:DNA/RNA-binding domain of Phe-tRNA-synthetase-like protein
MDTIFRYHSDVLSRFPDLCAGVILAEGVRNIPSPEGLRKSYVTQQEVVLESVGQTPLSELASVAAWRAAFRKFGVDPTQYRSAVEALLRRLTKKGGIPSINALVDLANLVSIHYALPVAAFDLNRLKLPITVRFSDGSERYTPLGESYIEHPEPGEVIFVDSMGMVIARRWCHRQSNESAARDDSTRVLFTVESQHKGGEMDVCRALEELQGLIKLYVGGTCKTALLP